jgi:putative DNA primase/helicase
MWTIELDSDPWTLNVLNGELDLRTGALHPHDPKHLHTRLAPVPYDPAAVCPRWHLFLAEIFPADSELWEFLRLLTGYLLTGDTREQAAFFLVGKGANGKSVLVETLRSLLGDYGRDTPSPLSSAPATQPPTTSPRWPGRGW